MIYSLRTTITAVIATLSIGATILAADSPQAGAALEEYLRKEDPHFNWKMTASKKLEGATVTQLEVLSQFWREQFWSHDVQIVRPTNLRNPDHCLLLIAGSGDGVRYIETLQKLANAAGSVAAVVMDVPNQPLYDGKYEDALIALTFDQYARSGDKTWPLLFPMVKSAVKVMDAIQQQTERAHKQKITKFVLTGASKRGWTTWLTSAVDERVIALAPMVFDFLNFPAQTEWAQAMYGRQSEQIDDYTELNLVDRINSPQLKELRSWVDPHAYINRYKQPKLILIGTNDRFWVVDSLRHYWNDLPGPKWIHQTPNAGHDLNEGREAIPTLAAWYQMIADGEKAPEVNWKFEGDAKEAAIVLDVSQKPLEVKLWTADSPDRDLRDDKWTSRPVELTGGSAPLRIEVNAPAKGYRAYMAEMTFKTDKGHRYKLSTEARVIPDTRPKL